MEGITILYNDKGFDYWLNQDFISSENIITNSKRFDSSPSWIPQHKQPSFSQRNR